MNLEPGPITDERLRARRHGCLIILGASLACWLLIAGAAIGVYVLAGGQL